MTSGLSGSDLTCSMASLAANDDPVGSAPDFSSFLLLTDTEPWSREAGADAARRYLSAEAARYCVENVAGLRTFAIRSPQRSRRRPSAGLPAFTGRVGGELRRCDDVPDRAALLAYTVGGSVDVGHAQADPLVGVCTNGRRDPCCAVLGRPIAMSLAERFGSRIYEISHLGGHRYAGTMVVLPTGYLYGTLDPDSAAEVVEKAIVGVVHPGGLRGRAGQPPAAQAAEAWWRRLLGPAPPEAVVITGTDFDGTQTRVDAVVEGTAASVRVSRRNFGEVAVTRCSAKPFPINRWEIGE